MLSKPIEGKLQWLGSFYLFLSTKDFPDNIFATEAVLLLISNMTADVRNISKMLAVINASITRYPWHKYLPMILSNMQNFLLRLYPPGVKQSYLKYITSSLPRQLKMKLEFSGPVGIHKIKVAIRAKTSSKRTIMRPNFCTKNNLICIS